MAKHVLHWIEPATLKVTGVVDEDVSFTAAVARFPALVHVDFSGVSRINSCGVREWVKAVAASPAAIRYVNTPTLIVDQLSMVPEFLGLHGTVESFDARYVCPSCGFEETARLLVGRDVQKGDSTPPARACGKCGKPSELDHNPDVYLEFLLHMV